MRTYPPPDPTGGLRILTVGAHPDDIEIGAGALICKALAEGHDVFMLVLTDDPVHADTRRREAIDAAAVLGVERDRVFFAGLPDGHLRVNRTTVRQVRDIVGAVEPDVVVTHTDADSHNDHVEANRLSHAAFRGAAYLHYSVHVSCEQSRFAPQIFVEVSTARLQVKHHALAAHKSQVATIARRDLAEHESMLGGPAGLDRCEAFEVDFQAGAANKVSAASALSEAPFHRMWLPLVRNTGITLLYPSSDGSAPAPDSAELHLNAGRDQLRQSFIDRWCGPRFPLREVFANSREAPRELLGGSLVLAGSPADNTIVRDVYNKIPKTRWIVDHDPGTGQSYVADRHSNDRLYPEFAHATLQTDVGLIARIEHPADSNESIVYVGGATALGTRAGLAFLANPAAFPDIDRLLSAGAAAEVVFTVDCSLDDMLVVDSHALRKAA